MMKKLFLLFCFIMLAFNTVYAATIPEPTKKVVLFYRVPDTILQCQNADEDIVAGAAELEKELKNHYSKRFIVQEIRKAPEEKMLPDGYKALIKPNQIPLIVTIDLEGQGSNVDYYQNAFGAKSAGVSQTVNVHLVEALPASNNNSFAWIDYGVQAYGAGTFAIGRDIFAAQTDPRKNVKNAVRGCFRDACKLNESINKYANPAAYEKEVNRFTGNFEAVVAADQKTNSVALGKIKKFEDWCKADKMRESYLIGLNGFTNINQKIIFIDQMIKMGVYKEN